MAQKGTMTTPKNPGNNPRMLWIRDHISHQGDDCLIWPYARRNGYGSYGRGGKALYVHRYMCEAIHGPAPTPTHHAAHSCGRGQEGCVNPRHLSWKTPSENERDKPPKIVRYKLTEEQVSLILSAGDPIPEIAKRFSVSEANIRHIKTGRTWKNGKLAKGGPRRRDSHICQ